MGKYRFLVNSPGAIAEFCKDYNIPDDVHLSLAELDTTPWRKQGFYNGKDSEGNDSLFHPSFVNF